MNKSSMTYLVKRNIEAKLKEMRKIYYMNVEDEITGLQEVLKELRRSYYLKEVTK